MVYSGLSYIGVWGDGPADEFGKFWRGGAPGYYPVREK